MDLFNSFLSLAVHLVIGVVLVIYLPLSVVWRLVHFVFVRPFLAEDLRGKVVLITGASSGIGEQLAYQYAKKGALLVLAARREPALQAVAKKAREHGAPDVLVVQADVSDRSESKRAVGEAIVHFGKLNHLVVNAGIFASCLFEEITNISAFNQVMDVNFWGSVYPTYYAIPHLRNSRGSIIVNASIAGRFPTARLSFYNASKAAMIRFYETLRSELGSDVKITILTPGYVASELTKGKALQKGGEFGFNEEVRDVQVGPLPVGYTKKCAEVIVDCARRGDEYVTWPSWYSPFHVVMCVAPELVNWFSRTFYLTKPGDCPGNTLSRKILEMTRAKQFLYPPSILTQTSNLVMDGECGKKALGPDRG
ncbi:11-beta-hydroxysteroid dehydrogenase 1B-like [Iris pallida]|uniref:11-beta-hydroxysteroid dehydrogenase 1B-like n=1 Tax=Iris pallida TaxID=29817 RepID=A0AAX6I0T0_IRIPA|nr:11-beta-hydroxysteroid dehydrogenase 1B-like [Iris pallida]KAJ6846055.1 11-beta-hydroxysteroid dehydrogenase 1B-like [Iris pallida]